MTTNRAHFARFAQQNLDQIKFLSSESVTIRDNGRDVTPEHIEHLKQLNREYEELLRARGELGPDESLIASDLGS